MAGLAAKDRTRSPRYPSYALEDGIEHARRIYAGVHRSPVDSHTVFGLMGFAGKSGASAKALGSLRQFGLIEGMGDNTRISDLTLQILEPAFPDERIEAISRASLTPDVFRSISERFGGKIPPVDDPVRAFLIREMGFSKSGADECISAMRRTFAFVAANRTSNTEESVEAQESHAETRAVGAGVNDHHAVQSPAPAASELMKIRLTRDCIVELRFEGTLSGKALENLIRHIELQKEVWLEE